MDSFDLLVREREFQEVAGHFSTLVRLGPMSVLVNGGRGSGKTVLLRRCARQGAVAEALYARCRPGDPDFAAAHQLMEGVVASAADRSALAPDSLLRSIIGASPCIVAIDDLQLIDARSADVLAYTLRNIGSEPVLFLFGTAMSYPADRKALSRAIRLERLAAQLPRTRRIQLTALSIQDIVLLADRSGAGTIDEQIAERIVEYTDGNPGLVRAVLAETPRERLLDRDRALAAPGSVVADMRYVFDQLPNDSRRLAGALAVLDARIPLSVAARVAELDDPAPALEPLLASGIARWWPTEPVTPVRIQTPAQRDAIYGTLTPHQRGALHRVAARSVGRADAWQHRVAAASGIDRQLASELASAASDAAGQDNYDAAARFAVWASDLDDDLALREHYLLTASFYLLHSRYSDQFGRWQDRVARCTPSAFRELVLGLAAFDQGQLESACSLLLRAFDLTDRTAAGSVLSARVALTLATVAAARDQPIVESHIARRVLSEHGHDALLRSWACYYLADAAGRSGGGPPAALAQLGELTSSIDVSSGRHIRPLKLGRAIWQLQNGQVAESLEELHSACETGAADRLSPLSTAASAFLGYAHFLLGDWNEAKAALDRTLARGKVGAPPWLQIPVHATAAALAGSTGDSARARHHLLAIDDCLLARSLSSTRLYRAFALASVAQAESDYPRMFGALNQVTRLASGPGEASYHQLWWQPMWCEALLRTGRLEQAAQEVQQLSKLTATVPILATAAHWLAGLHAAAGGEGDIARRRFEQGLALPKLPDDIVLHRARLEQSYGELLLEQRDRRAALRWLRRARDRFVSLNATPYVDRVSALVHKIADGPVDDRRSLHALSEQEYKVAHLVGLGLTNKEAAKELYVSPKTIEYHLGKIFIKLDLSSRRELRALLHSTPERDADVLHSADSEQFDIADRRI